VLVFAGLEFVEVDSAEGVGTEFVSEMGAEACGAGKDSASAEGNTGAGFSGPDEGDGTGVGVTVEEISLAGAAPPTVSVAALGVAGAGDGVPSVMGGAVETDAAASAIMERSAFKDEGAGLGAGFVSNSESAATTGTEPLLIRSSPEAIAALVRKFTFMKKGFSWGALR
jgi:hypothetical protein